MKSITKVVNVKQFKLWDLEFILRCSFNIYLLLVSGIVLAGTDNAAQKEAMKASVRDLPKLFSHKKHQTVFKGRELQCSECHNMLIPKDKSDLMAPIAPSSNQDGFKSKETPPLYSESAAKQVCHRCHVSKEHLPGKSNCILCHSVVSRPEDHFPVIWKQNHKSAAMIDRQSCMSCHRDQDCIACHQSRETILRDMHPRSYRYFHSIEARANSASCAACHRMNFCSDCHSKGVRP